VLHFASGPKYLDMLEAAVSQHFGAGGAADPEGEYQCEGYYAGGQAH
jgi:hypothetical protein